MQLIYKKCQCKCLESREISQNGRQEYNFVKEPASKDSRRASKQKEKPLVLGSRTLARIGSPASAANF
jgi:hypothetical protein